MIGSAYSYAEYGLLRASSSLSGIGGDGGQNSYAGAVTKYNDDITVTSKILPVGTPVTLTGTMYVHAFLSGTTAPDNPLGSDPETVFSNVIGSLAIANRGGALYSKTFELTNMYGLEDCLEGCDLAGAYTKFYGGGIRTNTFTISTYIGESISIYNSLASQSFSLGSFASGYSTFADASHTAGLFLSSDSADVSWISASGATYLAPSAVPEPENYALLLSGLGLFGFIHRKRQTSAC